MVFNLRCKKTCHGTDPTRFRRQRRQDYFLTFRAND